MQTALISVQPAKRMRSPAMAMSAPPSRIPTYLPSSIVLSMNGPGSVSRTSSDISGTSSAVSVDARGSGIASMSPAVICTSSNPCARVSDGGRAAPPSTTAAPVPGGISSSASTQSALEASVGSAMNGATSPS